MGSSTQERLTLEVPADLDGMRADRALAMVSGLTRSAVQRIVDDGGATRDGEKLTRRDAVSADDVIVLIVPSEDNRMVAEEMDLPVLYEDDDIAIIDKPAGLVVHPGSGNATGTLVHGMLHRWPAVRGVGEAGRWGIVHRLDRDTSGTIAVAKSDGGYSGLRSLVNARAMTRHYLALVRGALVLPTGTIDAPIGRDPRHPTRMRVQPEGRRAVSHYRLVEDLGPRSLVDVRLQTGRTHQIRVHLASIDLPVVGDRVYGRTDVPGIDPGRVWLHASSLEFQHPITGGLVAATAPLPGDLAASLEAARAER